MQHIFHQQTRSFNFKVENVGNVPMKVIWNFVIDDEYPARMDKQFNIADVSIYESSKSKRIIINNHLIIFCLLYSRRVISRLQLVKV